MVGGSGAIGALLHPSYDGKCRATGALSELLDALSLYEHKIPVITLHHPFLSTLAHGISPLLAPSPTTPTPKSSIPLRSNSHNPPSHSGSKSDRKHRFFSSIHCLRFPSEMFTFLRRLPLPLTSCSIKIPSSFCFLRFRAPFVPYRFHDQL
jgi:hypothetical protein